MAHDAAVYLGNDRLYRWQARKIDLTTGVPVPATGLSSVVAFISATKGGAAINAALQVTLTEIGTTGWYAGTLDATAIGTYLTAYVGQTVWECVRKTNDFEEWKEVDVIQYREDT